MSTVTLPGGFWYPERSVIAALEVGGIDPAPVSVAPGDALGVEFTLGPLRCGGIAMTVQQLTGMVLQFDLLGPGGDPLRSVTWLGTRSAFPSSLYYWAVSPDWEPVEITGAAHRLVCINVGAVSIALMQNLLAHDPTAPHLGTKVARTSGVWATDETRIVGAALHVVGA